MTVVRDDKGQMIAHIALSEQRPEIPTQQGDGICPECKVEEEIGFGLAGGGFGAYGYCPNCNKMLWKCQDDSDI